MIGVLALAGAERLCNALLSDEITSSPAYTDLIGKSLQLVVGTPSLSLTIVFAEDHLSFLPVSTPIFEPQGGICPDAPDCILSVLTLKDLYALLQHPDGAAAVSGNMDVWHTIQSLLHTLSPVMTQYETLITDSLLYLWEKLPLKPATAHNFNHDLTAQLDQEIQQKLDTLAQLDRQILAKQQQLSD